MSTSRPAFNSSTWLDQTFDLLDVQIDLNRSTHASSTATVRIRFDQPPSSDHSVESATAISEPERRLMSNLPPRSPEVITYRGMGDLGQNEADDRVTLKGMAEPDAIPAFRQPSSQSTKEDYESLDRNTPPQSNDRLVEIWNSKRK